MMTRDQQDTKYERIQKLLGPLPEGVNPLESLYTDEDIEEIRERTLGKSNARYQPYKINDYAWELYEAVGSYNYPAVTYDFERTWENRHCDCTPETSVHRQCMRKVEAKIRNQLLSGNTEVVKYGLANVLYWGHATNKFLQKKSIHKFQDHRGLDEELREFRRFCIDYNNNPCVLSEPVLHYITRLPQFGISFASKTMMLLDPENYPVLDSRIAKFVAPLHFPPLQGLSMNASGDAIASNQANEAIYDNWASWCRGIAHLVNSNPRSPRHDNSAYRASDVERGIFQLAKSPENDIPLSERKKIRDSVQGLLNGPQGWGFNVTTLKFQPTT